MSRIDDLKSKLEAFKRRYYLRNLVVGILLFLISAFVLFLALNSLEYSLWMGTSVRTILFYSSVLLLSALFTWLIIVPAIFLFKLRQRISDEAASQEIVKSFPEIKDSLLNTLQLYKLTDQENELVAAAIEKKSLQFSRFSFPSAVDLGKAKKYGLILGGIFICLILVSFINPAILTDSTERIINYNQEFSPEAPFTFEINSKLEGFRGEDFFLDVNLNGSAIPESLFLINDNGRKIRLKQNKGGSYTHLFARIQQNQSFQLEGAGYFSDVYEINVYDRPDMLNMEILIESPSYTKETIKRITNSGNVTALQGSRIEWSMNVVATDSMSFSLNKKPVDLTRTAENTFSISTKVFESGTYSIQLFNEFGSNSSPLEYNLEIIEDQMPLISAEYFPDSSAFTYLTIAGNIVDDHGFTSLKLNYKREDEKTKFIPLELAKNSKSQSYYASWNIDSLELAAGESLEFYVSVSDNDRVHGPKTSRSRSFFLKIPDAEELDSILDKKSQVVENQLDTSKKGAEDINERLKELEEKLKSEQKFDWQEEKQLEDIIQDREKLEQEIRELQKKHENLQQTTDQFKQRSQQQQEQNQQLQSLLDELLDEKTRELYEQLKELMKNENPSSEQVRQQLEDIRKNDQNLERELDRALELFKRLKMESALTENLQRLDSLSSRQSELSDQSLTEEMQQKQEDIQEEFNDFREKMDEVEELNQELKRPEALDDFNLEERQIAKELREIQEQIDQMNDEENQNSDRQGGESEENQERSEQKSENQKGNQSQKQQNINQKQKSTSQRMKQLSQKLQNMQSGMQMEMMQANLDQLRDILDNLIKLSFNQEDLMKEMRTVNQSDPRFLELSQTQLKLKDDAKVIQDSLLSLAEQVVQISSFVTREVGSINDNIDASLDFLKDRNRGRALSSQQFAMTSINNLALLLDDTMQQMQMAMSEAMGNPSQSQQQQKGLPDLQQMQQQLGEKVQELQGSGKQGRELSEELARLAAEQELIRRQLESIKEAEDGQPGGGQGDDLKRAIEQMEQNEVDLVNKRLTQQLLNRQKNIETRLLKAEKAQREQELEEEREAESPSVFSREIPPQFEEYLKSKQKEIELLKTIPVELNPFYKKEVNDYFRRISSEE